ncbi:hypothetical protein [Microbulbifer aggregans]|uniref:hypothetical protein n=1 Tax=Microbulbifer aggregans TaxID=1769779 RepID=UPI001CFCC660|nr:hypothetical protein [Microbulbifer aggregans]
MSPTAKCALLFLHFVLLAVTAEYSAAQSTNTDPCGNGTAIPLTQENNYDRNRFVGVCGLENNTLTFTHNETAGHLGEYPFSVRSCFVEWGETCTTALPYTVLISGEYDEKEEGFILRRDRGQGNQTTNINLTLSSGGVSHLIPPETEVPAASTGDGSVSSMFPGGANGMQVPVTLSVQLVNPNDKLQPGVYSGTFTLSIYQCGTYAGSGWHSVCNGSVRYTYLENIAFTIELRTESTIDISGVEDVALIFTPGEGASGSTQFCVSSSGGALFRITADSANGNGQFILQGSDQLQYSAQAAHLPSGRSEQLQESQASPGWPGHTDSQCLGNTQENMEILIRVDQSQIDQARDTNYLDTLTLTVELE